jgi:adenylate cyclase
VIGLRSSIKKLTTAIGRTLSICRPKNFPIAYKLALVFTVIISSGMVILGLVIARDQTRMLEQQIIGSSNTVVKQLAQIAKEPLLANDKLSLDVIVNNLIEKNGLLAAAIYSEEANPIVQAGVVPDNALVAANAKKKNMLHYMSRRDINDEPKVLVALVSPMVIDGLTVGYALISVDHSIMEIAKKQTIQTVGQATLLLIVIGFMASIILGKRLTRPIQQLMKASSEVSAGNYEFRFTNSHNDELGALMQAMNEMTEGLLRKEQVEKTFSRYVAPKVAREVLKNITQTDLGGRHVHASVLFADIVGYTELSERMPPDKVSALLNEYFGYIAQIVHIYQGHIDKYIGDCVMAVFGAPERDVLHAQHAVECAVLIQRLVGELNKRRKAQGLAQLMFHIGINSGAMLAGNIGSADRMEYTVMGKAVIIAARLTSNAGSGRILISKVMYDAIRETGHILCEQHSTITLRGTMQPLSIYSVVDVVGERRRYMKLKLEQVLSYSEEA